MRGNEKILLFLLITGSVFADDNERNTVTVTNDAISDVTESPTTIKSVSSSTETQPFPLLEDLVLAEKSAEGIDENHDDEKMNAKRTISGKFTGPIVVNENVNLFTPNDDFSRKQRINVQIIEPEGHNNGQFLKETVYQRQENSTLITSKTTTTSTTERAGRRKNIIVEQKFSEPIQVGGRSEGARTRQLVIDEDCDDPTDRPAQLNPSVVVTENTNRVTDNVKNTKVQKIYYNDEPKQNLVFGARVSSTTRTPCDQQLPCSSTTARPYRPSSTARHRPIHTTPLNTPRTYTTPRVVSTPRYNTPRVVTTPRVITSTVVSAPRIVTTPAVVTTSVVPVSSYVHVPVKPLPFVVPVKHAQPVIPIRPVEPVIPIRPVEPVIPIRPVAPVIPLRPVTPTVPIRPVSTVYPVTEKPVYIHTHSEVPVVHKEYVQLPPKFIDRPIIQKEYVQLAPKIIEKPIIQKEYVQLPPQVHVVEKPKVVIQKELVHLPPQERIVPVEVEKLVVKEVPINNVIEKHIQHPPTVVEKFVPYPVASKPIEVERIVQVPVDRVVEKPVPVNHIVEKPVAVPYVQYVDRPIHIPYILPVEIPVAYHVPYLVKHPSPPPPKTHFIIKTTKFGKGHGFFDWKHNLHNHHKQINHVIFKKPTHIFTHEDIMAPSTIDSIGLLPPPRFQPFISDNFGPKASASINVVQAVLPNAVLPNVVHTNREPFFEPSPVHNGFGSYDNKLKYVDSFSKDIRWEFGFKPPLIPSVAIDEFGNPLNKH